MGSNLTNHCYFVLGKEAGYVLIVNSWPRDHGHLFCLITAVTCSIFSSTCHSIRLGSIVSLKMVLCCAAWGAHTHLELIGHMILEAQGCK